MPERAKRFYLCNLIPLGEIDEEDMDVDWPVYHAYFGYLVEMRADIKNRRIRWHTGDGVTVDPDLKIRFEIHESDYLLFGGRNDHMGTFSSFSDFGDEPTVRPIKIVDNVEAVPEAEREDFIYIHWVEAHETTVTVTAPDGSTVSTNTERVPDTLQVRCWWRVTEEEGGDISGNPEYYYDVYAAGKLEDGEDFDLHERSDHELEGFAWNVTSSKSRGRVTPLVDGEYAFIKMLQLLEQAQSTIHILNWKIDPNATLVLEHEFQADYLQLPGMDAATYQALLTRNKPLTAGIDARGGFAVYTASNGNLVVATSDGASIVNGIQHRDYPTNIDLPSGVHVLQLSGGAIQVLFLDQLRSRLLLFIVLPATGGPLVQFGPGLFTLQIPVPGNPTRVFPFFEMTPTFPAIMADPGAVAGIIPIAGNGNPGHLDRGMARVVPEPPLLYPVGQLNRPTDVLVANHTIFISDTGNHCIRKIAGFNPADLTGTFRTSSFTLETLAGSPASGDADGAGASARFNAPTGLAWDTRQNRLLVADTGNHKIKAVNPSTGAVTTLAIASIDGAAGSLGEVFGLAFNPGVGSQGTLYVAERDRHRMLAVDMDTLEAITLAGSRTGASGHRDGAAATALFDTPLALAFDIDLVYVTDSRNHVVRVIELATGTVRTIGSRTAPGPQDIPVVLGDVLRRKAREGVTVRILMDDYGSGISRDNIGRSLIYIDGAQTESDLRFYHPSIQAFVQKHEQTVRGRSLGSNHEKMVVVDGRVGVTGGIDFAPDKNNGLVHERKHRTSLLWHDVAALVEGKAAFGLEQQFARRWELYREDAEGDRRPGELTPIDRTDATITDHEAESVRTYDSAPVLRDFTGGTEVKEVLESYKRAILAARYYVYMEHQYIYYPEIGDFIEQAMKDNRQLQVIWLIPFFTEEATDPVAERAAWRRAGILANSITDTAALADPRVGGSTGQIRSQISWHGFFRQHEMVEKFRRVDPNRFGVFSSQRLLATKADLSDLSTEMIYPHSKMILCDDQFFSIGSANANGRGFTTDGEHNVSAISPAAGKALRERLWGEHLGFMGVAFVTTDGKLLPISGHHLGPGDRVRLQHQALGDVEREVASVDGPSGAMELTGGPLDPAWGRVFWKDPSFSNLPLLDSIRVWRASAHSLETYRKVKGSNATTDGSGRLVVAGHLAEVGDVVEFGERVVFLNEEGSARSSDPIPKPFIGVALPVTGKTTNTIGFTPVERDVPNDGWIARMGAGEAVVNDETRPLQVTLLSRSGGTARIRVGLAPNLTDVRFDYMKSFMLRQPGAKRAVRAWEIDPPEGIEYGGPGSLLFSPWFLIPWLIAPINIDEQASLDVPGGDVRLA